VRHTNETQTGKTCRRAANGSPIECKRKRLSKSNKERAVGGKARKKGDNHVRRKSQSKGGDDQK